MDPQQEMIRHLLEKVKNAEATAADCEQLLQLVNNDQSPEIMACINQYYEEQQLTFQAEGDRQWKSMLNEIVMIDAVPEKTNRRVYFLRKWWWAAAAVIIVVSGWWFLQKEKPAAPAEQKLAQNNAIAPASNGAVLTLADGRTIILDSLKNGVITTQGNTAVKIDNGQLVYDAKTGGPVSYNTMTTPKGRQFRLVLPDGSQVWLNAASSITYPTAFTGVERKVSITGEAYFEVAKNTVPFFVSVKDMQVQVLGTHFNINAYENEERISTTLLQGKVKVLSKQSSAVLEPGQQAISTTSESQLTVNDKANIEETMAWKNGIFYFRNAGLEQVMRQLERWYNIDVEYKGKIPEYKINGKMDRSLNLQEILEFLAKMEVKYRLAGRTIIIDGE